MKLVLRKWWHGYIVSPWASLAGVALCWIVGIARAPGPALNSIGEFFSVALMGVFIAYVWGLLLLPLVVVFEQRDLRGWRVYVVTGLAAGLLTAAGGSRRYLVLCGLCGVFCAGVFAMRVAGFDESLASLFARNG